MRYSGVVTEVRHEWVWGGDVAMLPNRLNTSRGQSSLFSQQTWWFVERAVPQSEVAAVRALDHLYDRVVAELARYRSRMIATGDTTRQDWANWLTQWLRTEGEEIRDELARKIRLASSSDQMEMQTAIQAAEELVDLSERHVRGTTDDWDLIWEWAKEILPSLRRSFRQFPGSAIDEPSGATDAIQLPLTQTPATWRRLIPLS
ncbi:MAG: hypothetical protein AB1700_13365 [Bacillota bacterium]